MIHLRIIRCSKFWGTLHGPCNNNPQSIKQISGYFVGVWVVRESSPTVPVLLSRKRLVLSTTLPLDVRMSVPNLGSAVCSTPLMGVTTTPRFWYAVSAAALRAVGEATAEIISVLAAVRGGNSEAITASGGIS